MASIRTIIFDIGRVLVRVNVANAKTGLAKGLPLTPEELWSAIERDPRWQDWQEGRMSAHDWYTNLTARLGVTMDFAHFTDVWNSALDPTPIHPNSLFAGLAKSYRLGLLSNTDPLHVSQLESNYEFMHYFQPSRRTYSCVVGASKPDPRIFQHALHSCGTEAQESVYVDDIAAYVDAARGLGMKGIQFQSAEQLQEEFSALGIRPKV